MDKGIKEVRWMFPEGLKMGALEHLGICQFIPTSSWVKSLANLDSLRKSFIKETVL